ncbi:transcriptional regulator, AraC family [Novosphingobium aromaticivorans DSM 12444]|uniref:Transcriptional regulator, AraC family n=2 Tax=Novosphingobium aromaticivorans TaxID=48935 RepID=Q2GAI9_NOVAD|nr:transcriptional regulator, AraC family [Novosphingobium aromaticivorans DSM 12444]SCX84567.1 transcriptional regulator, AraC family [Novosphingobium aromaticivorans]
MIEDCSVRVRFHQPPPRLARYFTTFYLTELDVPGGGRVTDHLHPEWANLRFCQGDLPESELPGAPPMSGVSTIATGPTSTTLRFTVGTTRIWGVGLLPLGWARFVQADAHLHADRVYDVEAEPFLSSFRKLGRGVFAGNPDEAGELDRITAFFERALDNLLDDDPRILACHAALVDAEVSTVSEMAEAARLPAHTLERICRRNFGFTPRLLLRRQRFMRSLVQYMMDPSLRWIGAIDSHYHDQAQFVRDFHRFMGMSPREYAGQPKPVLQEVMRARQAFVGAAVQALHAPGRG